MADTLFSTAQRGGVAAGLNTNFRHRLRGVVRKDNSTEVALDAQQQVMRGFAYYTGDGSAWGAGGKSIQVTFPNGGFDNANVHAYVNYLGYRDGTNPTTMTDSITRDPVMIYSAGCDATLLVIDFKHYSDANTNNNRRYVFSWIAVGDKASIQD